MSFNDSPIILNNDYDKYEKIARKCSLIIFLKDHPVHDSYVITFAMTIARGESTLEEAINYVEELHRMIHNPQSNVFPIRIGTRSAYIPYDNIASFDFVDHKYVQEKAGKSRELSSE